LVISKTSSFPRGLMTRRVDKQKVSPLVNGAIKVIVTLLFTR
jgi:hypothetical protein